MRRTTKDERTKKEKKEKKEEKEKKRGEESDIKSNNPHLTGGEKNENKNTNLDKDSLDSATLVAVFQQDFTLKVSKVEAIRFAKKFWILGRVLFPRGKRKTLYTTHMYVCIYIYIYVHIVQT